MWRFAGLESYLVEAQACGVVTHRLSRWPRKLTGSECERPGNCTRLCLEQKRVEKYKRRKRNDHHRKVLGVWEAWLGHGEGAQFG